MKLKLPLRSSSTSSRRKRVIAEDKQSSKTFSYRSQRPEPELKNIGRLKERRSSQQPARKKLSYFLLQRFGLVILLIAGVACAVNILSLNSNAKVSPLTTSTNQAFLQPTSVYEAAASLALKNSVWNYNKVTIDTNQISLQMLNQFPELTKVSVTLPLLAHRPLVYVQPALPTLMLVTNSGSSFIVDSTGKAVIAGTSSSLHQLPILHDQSGLKIRLNHQALSGASVTFIQNIIAQLAAKQFTVSSMVLPGASSELDIKLAGQPYFVKFNLQRDDPRGQAGVFLATIAGLKRKDVTPGNYVDVRVEGRAYYQ